jgi:hypothetical protein
MTARSSRPLRRAIALLAAACALSLTGTATAHAQTWTHTDPAGDVVAFDGETESQAPAPTQERGDVRRVRVAHNNRRVVVRYSMRKALAGNHMMFYSIRTPKARFDLDRVRFPGMGGGVTLHKSGSEHTIRCSGMRWDIDRERATVAVSIPRRCIGRPRWVRVGVIVMSLTDELVYIDDALSGNGLDSLRQSPRVYRG